MQGQTFRPKEIIVVDDGSVDDTRLVLEKLGGQEIRYFRTSRRGANHARNVGAEAASSEWLAFQDSDDYWSPDKLETQIAALLGHSTDDIIACFSQVIEHCDYRVRIFPLTRPHSDQFVFRPDIIQSSGILKHNLVSTQTLMVRTATFRTLGGFDERLPRFQDWEMAIRLMLTGNVLYLPTPLAVAEKGFDSITRNFQAGIIARQLIYNRYKDRYSPLQQARSVAGLLTRRLYYSARSKWNSRHDA